MRRVVMTLGLAVALSTGALAACAAREAGSAPDSAGAGGRLAPAGVASVSWRFEAPGSWDDRVVIADEPAGVDGGAGGGVQSARLFNYLPFDTTVAPQTLLGVYVYDSTSWARLEQEEGPPAGELIARGPGVVYVAGFPQSNPFAPGSRDAQEFDRRSVTREYVATAFRAVP
jgi:hypothetical protein